MAASSTPFASDKQEDFLEVKSHIDAGDLEWVLEQLQTKRLSPEFRLGRSFTPAPTQRSYLIVFCVQTGQEKLAYEIARRSCKADLDLADSEGKTALMYSACLGKTSLVIALLSLGADHTLQAQPYQQTALQMAKGTLNQETVRLLTDYSDLATEEERKAFIDSRLEGAVYNIEVRHRLLCDDGEWMEQELASGRLSSGLMFTKDESLLFRAVTLNKNAVVHPLLRHGADPNDTNEYNSSVLVGAAANLNEEVFRLLLIYGAEYRTYEEVGEESPEFNCMENGNTELPAYASSWLNMSEAERLAEMEKHAPELSKRAAEESERLKAMSREGLYDVIAGLKTQVKAFEDLKRELKRRKRWHHDLTSEC